jgi:folate-binding protein YgfZ
MTADSSLAVLVPRGVVRITGDEAATYLQGQVSQDVEAIAEGEAAWSLVLDPGGKLVSWFRLHRLGPAEFLLDVEPAAVPRTVARLERFKLRTAVDFSVEDGWRMVAVRGEAPPPAGDLAVPFDWPGFAGTDVLLAPGTPDPAIPTDDVAFEQARIRAGVPRLDIDITEDTIPAEGGAPLIDGAVSFTKGCYTGQELVARIDSRGGNVPRPVRVLTGDDTLAVGDDVALDGDVIGTVTSAEGLWALAPLRRKAEPGTRVDVGGTAATVGSPGDVQPG